MIDDVVRLQDVTDRDWKHLLDQIRSGTCVPFIGPELSTAVFGSKSDIAQAWSAELGYPFEDRSDLARVSQYLAVQNGSMYPVNKLIASYGNRQPDFHERFEPHRVLAEMPLPLYITTNYDSSMKQALKQLVMSRDPKQEYCCWRPSQRANFARSDDDPTPAQPLVFHLFGHIGRRDSLVLTEHDYLQFLINVSQRQQVIPEFVQGAIAEGSLLFIGYRFDDWDFRVLIHTIANFFGELGNVHFSVVTPAYEEQAAIYLRLYFGNLPLRIYRGTAQAFVQSLKAKWEEANG